MVHEWANICDELHPICFNSPSSPLQNSSRLPTRILDLGEADAEAKIISGNAIKAKYVALSYCWGTEVDSHPKITKATLPIWSINLPSDILPVLFGDAISLTRALGVRYLWIDSLCILQDDIHDWEMESENMAAVYEGSWLTIAATLAPSPGISLLGPRWSRKTHSQAQTNSPVTKTERAELHCPPELFSMEKVMSWINPKNTDNAEAHITDAPLMTRAWAFQERLLAPRTLHFHAEELAWECRAGVTCECGELEVETQSNISEDWRPTGWLKKSLTVVKNPKATTDQIGYVWLDIVSEFSKLHLTKESDRMPALSGIASTMCDGIMGEYIAGIWRNDLPCGLLFERARKAQHTSNDHRDLLETSDPSKPSWSWSSFPLNEFPISYDSVLRRKFVQDPEFSVLDARVNTGESAKNRFSWPANTTLSVRGRVWKVRFRLFEEDSFISHDSKNSSVSLAFLNDGTVELKEGELLHCLFVGKTLAGSDSQYALVLRRCTRYYRTFQRVGLAYIDKVFGLPTTNTLSDCVLI
ncbi:HET-domain-containing protein [Cadophora sp. DSE1049]|nr:HET-domain-containing protein [Cadophora sp. DSE1049]